MPAQSVCDLCLRNPETLSDLFLCGSHKVEFIFLPSNTMRIAIFPMRIVFYPITKEFKHFSRKIFKLGLMKLTCAQP